MLEKEFSQDLTSRKAFVKEQIGVLLAEKEAEGEGEGEEAEGGETNGEKEEEDAKKGDKEAGKSPLHILPIIRISHFTTCA